MNGLVLAKSTLQAKAALGESSDVGDQAVRGGSEMMKVFAQMDAIGAPAEDWTFLGNFEYVSIYLSFCHLSI